MQVMPIQFNPYQNLSHTTYRAPAIALPSANSELGVTARDIGQAIADYSHKVHNNLEDWHTLTQELSDFLKFAKPMAHLLMIIHRGETTQ